VKRATRRSAVKAPRPPEDPPRTALPLDRHSGEGAASALETLQKLESARHLRPPPERGPEDDPG
jgi:hypothetical protein